MHESNHSPPPPPRARFLLLVSATYVESSADGYHCCAILRSLTVQQRHLYLGSTLLNLFGREQGPPAAYYGSMYYFGPAASSPSLELDHPSTSGI